MEIEQHIKNLKDYIRIDKENINYDDSDFAQFCKSHCEDIQAVLDELDNRISRKDIEDKKKECENRRFSDFTNEPNFAVEKVLNEILDKE